MRLNDILRPRDLANRRCRLAEVIVAQDQLADRYYHGTPKASSAKDIIENGLQVPDFEIDNSNGWQAKAGKAALKRMPPSLKLWLIGLGCHIAHRGSVKPAACWRIDKAKIGWLQIDGGNFFEIAEPVA